MSFDHAGLWAGVLAPNQVFSVYQAGTRTPATLYADADMSVTAGSSVASDGNGNVVFYAAPASYDLLAQPRPGVSEPPITVTVAVNPLDVGGGGGGPWGQSSTAKYAGSGSPVGVVTPSGVGDLYVDDTTPALWQATGTANTDWQVQGGTSGQVLAPVLLPSVKWAMVIPGNANTGPDWAYTPNSWPTVATSITANADGFIYNDPSWDGASNIPSVGDRVVVMDEWNEYFQLFTVTDIGSGSAPWVLTATDDDITGSWAVEITEGTVWAGGLAISSDAGTNNWNGSTASGNGSTASGFGSTASGFQSTASGIQSTASGNGSTASGFGSTASGNGSTASGNGSTASGDYSTASGNQSTASGNFSTASGNYSTASGNFSTASGNFSTAYEDGQFVDASNSADCQHSTLVGGITTTDATPTATQGPNGQARLIRFVDATGSPVWNRTIKLRTLSVIARRTDTPSTDACFDIAAPAICRGDGTSAYTWVGGSAPTVVQGASDVAAAGWTVTIAIAADPAGSGAAALIVTVTGEAANTIAWEVTAELDEVAG